MVRDVRLISHYTLIYYYISVILLTKNLIKINDMIILNIIIFKVLPIRILLKKIVIPNFFFKKC